MAVLLNSRERKILTYIKGHHNCRYTDILSHFNPKRKVIETDNLLKCLSEAGLIKPSVKQLEGASICRLTHRGHSELLRNKEDWKKQCWDELRAWAAIVMSLVALVISICFN